MTESKILAEKLKIKFFDYLQWNETQLNTLLQKGETCAGDAKTLAILDLPLLKSDNDYYYFFNQAKQAGFKFFNLGLTQFWTGKISTRVIQIGQECGVDFPSAHGTSIKYAIKNELDYQKVLENDLLFLKKINPQGGMVVNYDLFAGHHSSLIFADNYSVTKVRSLEIFKQVFKIPNLEKTQVETEVLERIIEPIVTVFGNSAYTITFELPGSKGWSIFPSLNELTLEYLFEKTDSRLPGVGLTIDLAHALTWGKDAYSLQKIKSLAANYKKYLRMLHITSAGSDHPLFADMYSLVYEKKYPDWHVSALDVSLFICEREMIGLVSDLRAIAPGMLYEVSETRFPSAVIQDYFSRFEILDFDDWFYKNIGKYGKILGYNNIWTLPNK